MFPVFFELGPITLHTYGVLLTVAVLLGLSLARSRAFAAGLDGDRIWNLGVYMVLAALLVAKIWLVLANFDYYRHNLGEIFSLSTLQSGGVFYGGFLGGAAVALYGAWLWKLPMLKVLDVVSPSLMLGATLGRLGCFAAGCCWGEETSVAWAVTFTNEYSHRMFGTPLGSPRHPTQLYDAAAAALILLLLLWLSHRQRFTGQVFGALAMFYGAARFVTEFFRDDPGRELFFTRAVSQAQLVGLLLFAVGVVLWWRGRSRTA